MRALSHLGVVFLTLMMGFVMVTDDVYADDSQRLVRSVSSEEGVTEDPEPQGEHAFIKLMNFHVPSQNAAGELVPIEYWDIDDVLVRTEETAKPLVNVYVYGPVIGFDNPEASGFAGHGRRDAFAAVSLDDGENWSRTNLSQSADDSSFVVSTPLQDPGVPAVVGVVNPYPPNTLDIWFTDVVWIPSPSGVGGHLKAWGEAAPGIPNAHGRNVSLINYDNAFLHDLSPLSRRDSKVYLNDPHVPIPPCAVQMLVDTGDGILASEPFYLDVENCIGVEPPPPLITDYPGDVTNIFHAVAGNRVLVAWQSKFCSGGNPFWGDEFPRDDVASYLGIDNTVDLYLTDLFGVSGSQGSTNYGEPVGEVPYSCLWSARGVLRENPEEVGTTEVVWFQAERLTSGRRDVNRIETACVANAGCAITWQEDPEGVRPGEGEGPGTGWSGATTNSQTDIWYSFIEWEDFDIVNDDGTPVPLADNIFDTGRPQPYVPMMAAVRLTNNDRCNFPVAGARDYCEEAVAGAYGIIDQCVGSVEIPLGPQGDLTPICVVDSNVNGIMDYGDLPNVANTAASRPRLNLQPRDSDGDGVVDDAWVVVVSEEDKGLGAFGFGFLNDQEWVLDNLDGTALSCEDPDADLDDNCAEPDPGKDVFWASFNLGSPDTSEGVGVDYSLVSNVLSQGAQLNQPEVNWRTGTFYPPMDTADMWDFGDLNYLIFNTEIARRTALMTQNVDHATAERTQDGLVAMPLWKQGIVNQGGPADIMARRIVASSDVDETTENPYAASNMVCAWYDGEGLEQPGVVYFDDGSNPYYPSGLCMAAPINLSARTPFECEVSGNSDGVCPGNSDMTCVEDPVFGQLCLSTTDPEDPLTYDKMLSWYECPGWNGNNVSGDAAVNPSACGSEPDSALLGSNLDDQSWYNPLDVAKAQRGFLDGDFVSMIYAWSPNWRLNEDGQDRYELYNRRSFDGGVTWTTTPASFLASDGETYSGNGTVTCETMRDGGNDGVDSHVCTEYAAGEPEQPRNVSQGHFYGDNPQIMSTAESMATDAPVDITWGIFEPIDPTDFRDPKGYFVVYEIVVNNMAEELNLSYGRAEVFGDHFTVWSEIDTGLSDPFADCYPSNAHDDTDIDWAVGTGFCNEFDTLEGYGDALSEEASITASAYGDFLYGVWGQFNVDEAGEFVDGDSMFRRIWYLDDYISATNSYTLP